MRGGRSPGSRGFCFPPSTRPQPPRARPQRRQRGLTPAAATTARPPTTAASRPPAVAAEHEAGALAAKPPTWSRRPHRHHHQLAGCLSGILPSTWSSRSRRPDGRGRSTRHLLEKRWRAAKPRKSLFDRHLDRFDPPAARDRPNQPAIYLCGSAQTRQRAAGGQNRFCRRF
jgi:hypothetical protein